jgi:hypothetical protein
MGPNRRAQERERPDESRKRFHNEFLTMVLLNNDRQDAPPATARAAMTTALRRFLSMQWWITAPLPLKVAYFGLACALVFGLAAAIAGIEFGREAEDQVVEITEDLLTIASLGGGPMLVMGLISSFARRRTSGAGITLGAEAMRRASAQGDAASADRRAPKD